jgi:NADH-quinone oxidoreductase subunit G
MTVHLTIDGREIAVAKGTTVHDAAKQLQIEIPIFCYHDRMPPFGACRVCLVEVEKSGKLQTSCTLEATDDMVVRTQSALAQQGHKEILELLLINHPLDCPICDKGGECPLQDNTLKYGPGASRFIEEKRHFQKPKPLGPVLMLDRERCIACARCTRFSDIISGDHALEFQERGFRTEVCTHDGGTAESKFIGNTIMICPVGALTSQVYRFRARPWDNDHAESSCTLCPVGCNLYFDSRDGELMRTRSRENHAVNDIWMCDKGWFGYQFTDHRDRLQQPLLKTNGKFSPISWADAFALVTEKITQARPQGRLAGFGGNPLTTEENFLFQKLMREGAGVDHVDHRIGMPLFSSEEEILEPGMRMPIGDCEQVNFALILGCDLTEEFPVIWLRLRQGINKSATVHFLGHYAPETATYFKKTLLHAPGQEIEMLKRELADIAQHAVKGRVAIFVGSQYLNSEKRGEILSALSAACQATPNLTCNVLEGRGNSMGARAAGMRPDLSLKQSGLNALQVMETMAESGWDFLYIAGADAAKKFPRRLWERARANLGFLVVNELFMTETAKQADLILPTVTFVEKEGHFTNIEGKKQHLRPGKSIPSGVLSDGEIFEQLLKRLSPYQRKENAEIPRTRARNRDSSGDLKATFAHQLFDQGVRMKHNEQLFQMVKEPQIRLHTLEASKRKLANGMIVIVRSAEGEVRGTVKVDDRVAGGTVVIPLGFDQIPAYELGAPLWNGLSVTLSAEGGA